MKLKRLIEDGVKSGTVKLNEGLNLKVNGEYAILDEGVNEWITGYKYLGRIGFGSSVGELRSHMFMLHESPGEAVFIDVRDTDLKDLVRPSR